MGRPAGGPGKARVSDNQVGLIGGFTRWKEHDAYQKALERLLRDLKVKATPA